MHEPFVYPRADDSPARPHEVDTAGEEGEARGLDIVWDDLGEEDHHGERAEGHGDDLAEDVGKDDERHVGNAEVHVPAHHQRKVERGESQAENDTVEEKFSYFCVLQFCVEQRRADGKTEESQNVKEGISKLADVEDVSQKVIRKGSKGWAQDPANQYVEQGSVDFRNAQGHTYIFQVAEHVLAESKAFLLLSLDLGIELARLISHNQARHRTQQKAPRWVVVLRENCGSE